MILRTCFKSQSQWDRCVVGWTEALIKGDTFSSLVRCNSNALKYALSGNKHIVFSLILMLTEPALSWLILTTVTLEKSLLLKKQLISFLVLKYHVPFDHRGPKHYIHVFVMQVWKKRAWELLRRKFCSHLAGWCQLLREGDKPPAVLKERVGRAWLQPSGGRQTHLLPR